MQYIESVANLIAQLSKLPGIGPKTAQRLAFYILNQNKQDVETLAHAIYSARENVRYCTVCGSLTDVDPCAICTDARRDSGIICVVGETKDVIAMERLREFRGKYHVLGGAISPIDGVSPDQLNIKSLLARIDSGVKEIILANNPDIEGEATAIYLSRLLKPLGVKVSRIAQGIPIGGDLEYTDEITLMRAIEARREL